MGQGLYNPVYGGVFCSCFCFHFKKERCFEFPSSLEWGRGRDGVGEMGPVRSVVRAKCPHAQVIPLYFQVVYPPNGGAVELPRSIFK